MAKKFIFRLESLLNLKSFKVKEIEEAIQRVLYFRYQTEEEIAENEEYLASLNNSKNGLFRAFDIQVQNNHKDFVKNEIIKLRQQLDRINEIEQILRNRLSEAKKEEKILEKIKEKKFIEHQIEQNREETKLLDEISINKEIRKSHSDKK
ncbi:MAG: flagellar export protein FliJ [Ignavibacteria bacterium]|nr:flagellar export protein FliJ [Ignavibacteria bacterium]